MSRRTTGEGTIYQRADGRWEAAAWLRTVSGKRKRVRAYDASREGARRKLTEMLRKADQHLPTPDAALTLGQYLDHWMTDVVPQRVRPTTRELYEMVVRTRLKPGLGRKGLARLSVRDVQTFLNDLHAGGLSARSTRLTRMVLRAALNRAIREELIFRNVASLVDLPSEERTEIVPWSAQQASAFIAATRGHRLHAAFLVLTLYGLRRGEVLGLRYEDLDFAHQVIHVNGQLQRVDHELVRVPVKTSAGVRDLPMPPTVSATLLGHLAQPDIRRHPDGLIFTNSAGGPLDPHGFTKTFQTIRERAGLPRIRLHDLRHAAATLLKDLGAPPRDVQAILGHAHITTTLQIYQHSGMDSRRIALTNVERALTATDVSGRSRQKQPSATNVVTAFRRIQSGGPGGARTLDTLLKSIREIRSHPCNDELARLLDVHARSLKLGFVAVRGSRQERPIALAS